MQQEKQHGAHGGRPCPAVCGQQRVHLRQPERVTQTALCQIAHHGDRQHDLVGRKAEHECQQQHAVHAHDVPERVERSRAPRQQAHTAGVHVCQRPQNHACRRCHGGGAPEHEQRPVENGAHDYLTDLRRTVWRQLQREGRRLAAQHGRAQQPRCAERQPHAQHERRREQQRGGERTAAEGKEHGHERDERRKAAVARHEAVGEHGEQPFALGVDDPAADHTRCIAAEPHAHRQRLLAAGAARLKRPVEIVRHARQIPCVLKQREQREKDRHRRQHHGHDPCQRPEHTVHQQPLQPGRCVQEYQQRGKPSLHPAEKMRQPLRRRVCARDRQPQHGRQPQQHDGVAGRAAREQAVEPPVTRGIFRRLPPDGCTADDLCAAHIVRRVSGLRRTVRARLRRGHNGVERIEQGAERFLFPRRHAHDRHTELRLQRGQVDADAFAPRLVKQIHAHDRVRRYAVHLQREHERALETRRVAHDDHGVRFTAAHKVARDSLLGRVRLQRVGAREVDEQILLPRRAAAAARTADGFPGPVSGVLAHPGQGVEDGALADVRVARQRHDALARAPCAAECGCVRADGAVCQSHVRTSSTARPRGWRGSRTAAARSRCRG